MQRKVGRIVAVDVMSRFAVIQPLDQTDRFIVGLGEIRPRDGGLLPVGTMVSFRERFHTAHRIAWDIKPTPANVIAFSDLREDVRRLAG